MRKSVLGSVALVVGATTIWSCGGTTMPTAPSALSSATAPGAGGVKLGKRDDPTTPAPDPNAPPVDPNAPPVDPNAPPVDPNAPPMPTQVMIAIIGSFGMNAFLPNPIQAAIGNTIVWQNNDIRVHHIVLDDGTDLGEVAPGQMSLPATMTGPTATFHCLIHPTMVGTLTVDPVLPPDPYMPPDPYAPPPDDGYYGYY